MFGSSFSNASTSRPLPPIPTDDFTSGIQKQTNVLKQSIEEVLSGVTNKPQNWRPVTLVIVPDMFLDAKCYQHFQEIIHELEGDFSLRILTLPTYSRDRTRKEIKNFDDDVHLIRKELQYEIDQLKRDVIIIGHGYGLLAAGLSAACLGLIRNRVPHHRVGFSKRSASIQGIISMSGWLLVGDASITSHGPDEIIQFRVYDTHRVSGNKRLLQLTTSGKRKLIQPPDGESYDAYIGYCSEGLFDAKASFSPFERLPNWHLIFRQDKLFPKKWAVKHKPSKTHFVEIDGRTHTPFFTDHWETIKSLFLSDTGPIRTIQREHETKTGDWYECSS